MWKVTITNSSNGMVWGNENCANETEAQEWLARQIGKPDRLPERIIKNENGPITVIPQEFISEIIDLSKDEKWVEKDVQEKRKKEYPNETEVIEAIIEHLMEGKPQKLKEIQSKREAIKIKYPKAEKSK